jgi:hypothetical protein
MSKLQTIENHRLSDGGLALVRKLGRKYSFTRTFPSDDEAPEVTQDLNKATAYFMLEQTLKNDVLEADL